MIQPVIVIFEVHDAKGREALKLLYVVNFFQAQQSHGIRSFRSGNRRLFRKMNSVPFASRKALIGGLIMLCCALVVLTLIATPSSVSLVYLLQNDFGLQWFFEMQGPTALKAKKDPWADAFGWYANAAPDSEIGLVARYTRAVDCFLYRTRPEYEFCFGSHMKQFNARELYYPIGTFPFDQGTAKLAGGEGIYH
jgi:hypothetical protein